MRSCCSAPPAIWRAFPALLSMVRRGHLDVPIIGVATGGGSVDSLRARVRQGLEELEGGLDATAFSRLSGLLRYVDGDYQEDDTWKALRAALGPALRPLHYLAIPPSLFPTVLGGLGRLGVGDGARLIVEKPFGRDLASARSLNRTIHQVFDEDSVFRIDHYLGKYERLIGDAMLGDATLFGDEESVEATWAVVDPIVG